MTCADGALPEFLSPVLMGIRFVGTCAAGTEVEASESSSFPKRKRRIRIVCGRRTLVLVWNVTY